MKKLLFILLFLPVFASATVYYVSTGGSDGNNGTSAGTSWASLSKVSGFSFSAGDQVLFNRGDSWAGTLTLSASGSLGNHIIIGAYGTGAKPIITRRTIWPGWVTSGNWTLTGITNVWRSNPNPVAGLLSFWPRIWLNGVESTKGPDSSQLNANHRMAWFNGAYQFLYLYSTTNPATAFSLIEYPGSANNTIYFGNTSYWTIHDMDIRGSTGACIDIQFHTGLNIYDCNVGMDAGRMGVRSDHGFDVNIYNNTFDSGDRIIDSFNVPPTLQDCIYIAEGSSRWEVYGNRIMDFGHSGFEVTNYSSDSLKDIHIYKNYVTGLDVDYFRGFAYDCNNGKNVVFEYNLFEDLPIKNQIEGKNLIFRYNVINRMRNTNHFEQGTGVGLSIAGYGGFKPINMQITNNTIANCESAGLDFTGTLSLDGSYEDAQNNFIANNIFYNNGNNVKNAVWFPTQFTAGVQLYIRDDPDVLNNIFKNNVFYKSGVADLIWYGHSVTNDYLHTVAEFNAEHLTAGDTILNNIAGNPSFLNGASDFTIQALSVARAAGINLGTTYQTGLQTGSIWPSVVTTLIQSVPWDIGAFIYSQLGDNGELIIHRKVITR